MRFLFHTFAVLLAYFSLSLVVQAKRNFGHFVPEGLHVEVSPRKVRNDHVVPVNFTWADHNGTNYLTHNRNQMIPIYCGSCWAHAVTHVLSDRIKIRRHAAWPDINLSPQVLISCDPINRGCNGGWHLLAFKWIQENGVTDETCSPYRARGHNNGLE